MSLIGEQGALLEEMAVDVVLDSPERIPSTRGFRYTNRRGLIEKMMNVSVRLADATDLTLGDVRRRAKDGCVSVFYGTVGPWDTRGRLAESEIRVPAEDQSSPATLEVEGSR